ncbi:MAG: hypothetical protein V4489_04250 [Chlamydiota bacterium]
MINNSIANLQGFIEPVFSTRSFDKTSIAIVFAGITAVAILAISVLEALYLRKRSSFFSKPCYVLVQDMYQNETRKLPSTYFEEESRKVVNLIVKKIQNTIKKSKSGNAVGQCFLKLVDTLGRRRMKIAQEQNTDNYTKFGEKRLQLLCTPFLSKSTYGEYAGKIKYNLLRLCKDNINDLKSGRSVVKISKIKGYTSKFTFRFIEKDEKISDNTSRSGVDITTCLKMTMHATLREDPEADIGGIHGHVDLEKNGVSYSCSDYCVLINKYFIGTYLEDKAVGELILTHQDPDFTEKTMKEAKHLFTKCITCKSEQELKENMAIFRYLFAHMAPYNRGSASIAEWIEKAVYKLKCPKKEFRYGDQPIDSNRRPLADLDALAELISLPEFMKDYLSKVVLEEKD